MLTQGTYRGHPARPMPKFELCFFKSVHLFSLKKLINEFMLRRKTFVLMSRIYILLSFITKPTNLWAVHFSIQWSVSQNPRLKSLVTGHSESISSLLTFEKRPFLIFDMYMIYSISALSYIFTTRTRWVTVQQSLRISISPFSVAFCPYSL